MQHSRKPLIYMTSLWVAVLCMRQHVADVDKASVARAAVSWGRIFHVNKSHYHIYAWQVCNELVQGGRGCFWTDCVCVGGKAVLGLGGGCFGLAV